MKRFYIKNGFNLNANSITGLKLIGYNSNEIDGNLSEKNELGIVKEFGYTDLYKVYTALLTQSGTNPPSVKVLENQLGSNINWTYSDVGRYVGTLVGAFTASTTILVGSSFALNTGYAWAYATSSNDSIYLNVENDGGYADDELLKTAIELKVYSSIPTPVGPTPSVPTFVSTWRTTNAGSGSDQVQLPLVSSGTYNFVVDWGDGNNDTITTWNQAETLHTYTSSGDYIISITGQIEGWSFNGSGDCEKILEVTKWSNLKLGNDGGYFNGCVNLDLSSVSDILDLTGTTNLSGMFVNCGTITTINNIESWDVSGVTNMIQMFYGTSFNQDISGWNVSNVADMSSMFSSATSFNQPIGSWDVSSVTDMNSMFGDATLFNQDIGSWNVSSVTDMSYMFSSKFNTTSFNQPIGSWNVSSVTNMYAMFRSSTSFNQDIGGWTVSNVTNMSNFMTGKTNLDYSTTNYDNLLNSWSLLTLQPSLTLDMGTIQYTSSGSASRAILTGSPNNWTINDGGMI